MTSARTIAVRSHGRYLGDIPANQSPAGLLLGCHGYAEDADMHLERLRGIPGSDQWIRVSVQALHRFYRGRTQAVVGSWMTRQDRELTIADNIEYMTAVAAEVIGETERPRVTVFAGFSQGASMAFRAAGPASAVSAVIALGGDIPGEIPSTTLAQLRGVLIGRGTRDEWYTAEKWNQDLARLRGAGAVVQSVTLEAAHEWPADFSRAAGEFLARFA
jgi:predicted esterase